MLTKMQLSIGKKLDREASPAKNQVENEVDLLENGEVEVDRQEEEELDPLESEKAHHPEDDDDRQNHQKVEVEANRKQKGPFLDNSKFQTLAELKNTFSCRRSRFYR